MYVYRRVSIYTYIYTPLATAIYPSSIYLTLSQTTPSCWRRGPVAVWAGGCRSATRTWSGGCGRWRRWVWVGLYCVLCGRFFVWHQQPIGPHTHTRHTHINMIHIINQTHAQPSTNITGDRHPPRPAVRDRAGPRGGIGGGAGRAEAAGAGV
jgi:hypothetical protein